MSTVLEVEGLRTEFRLKSANVVAVDDVTFHVDGGECVGVVGESGCGKTTIGLSIMKLLPPVGHVIGGSIKLQGQDLAPLTEKEMTKVRGNQVGMVFQDPLTSLNPTMNIGDQIAESARLHQGASKSVGRSRALDVLRMVEMPNAEQRLDAYAHELSGGLRQRVMIAMALVCSPKLLIADEPTTALDVTIQAQILDLLDRLRADLDMSVILITHDMGVIAERAERVIVMYAGRIAESASHDGALHRNAPSLRRGAPGLGLQARPGPVRAAGEHSGAAARSLTADRALPVRGPMPLRPAGLPGDRARPPARRPRAAPTHLAACFHQVDVDPNTIAKRPEAVAMAADLNVKVDEVALARHVARAESLAQAPVLVRVDHAVKEFALTSGAVVRRKVGTVKAVSDVSLSIRQR